MDRRVLPLLLLALGIAGCRTYGTISVDRPEVFTRERLTAARAREQQWLEKKLAGEDPAMSFQGLRDVRTFTGFYNSFSAKYDPLGGKLADAIIGREIKNADDATRLDRLDYQVETARRRQELRRYEALEAGEAPPESGVSATQPSTSASQVAAGSTQPEGVLGFGSASDFPPLQAPKPEKTAAELTSIEQLRDAMAYRNAVNAALREHELDDTHDLSGSTLYTLKFDVTLSPPEDGWWWQSQNHDALGRLTLSIERANTSLQAPCLEQKYGKIWAAIKDTLVAGLPTEGSAKALSEAFEKEAKPKPQEKAEDKAAREKAETEKAELRSEIEDFVSTRDNLRLYQLYLRWCQFVETSAVMEYRTALERISSSAEAVEDHLELLRVVSEYEPSATPKEFVDAKAAVRALASQTTELRAYALKRDAAQDMRQSYPKLFTFDPEKDEQSRKLSLAQFDPVHRFADQLVYATRAERLLLLATTPRPTLRRAIAYGVAARYRLLLGSVIHVSVRDAEESDDDLKLLVTPRRTRFPLFAHTFKNLVDQIADPYVYSVEPKEQAQNISEVAAHETLLRMVASVQALLPNGIGLSNHSEYLNRSQTLLNAINRRPLVVGFAHSRADTADADVRPGSFGWLFGPRFLVDDGEAGFEFTPVQHSLQASVVVPFHWDAITIHRSSSWIRPDGAVVDSRSLGRMSVELPASRQRLEALTNLFASSSTLSAAPTIYPGPPVVLRAGAAAQTLLIHGRDLWRNPRVFVGNQPADSFELLPDMNGLVATFKQIAAPAQAGTGPVEVDLTVVTSMGVAKLNRAVTILPAKPEAAKPAPRVELLTHKLPEVTAAGAQVPQVVRLKVGAEAVPAGYHSLRLRVRPQGQSAWVALAAAPTVEAADKSKVLTFKVTIPWDTSVWGPKASAIFEVQLQRIDTPGAEAATLPKEDAVAGRLAYLKGPHPSLTRVGKTLSLSDLKVTFVAYPGLETALRTQAMRIELEAPDNTVKTLKVPTGFGISPVPTPGQIADDETAKVSLKLTEDPAAGSSFTLLYLNPAGVWAKVELVKEPGK